FGPPAAASMGPFRRASLPGGPRSLRARLRRPSGGTRVRERLPGDPERKAPCRWMGGQPKATAERSEAPKSPQQSLAFEEPARVVELVRHGRLKSDCPCG